MTSILPSPTMPCVDAPPLPPIATPNGAPRPTWSVSSASPFVPFATDRPDLDESNQKRAHLAKLAALGMTYSAWKKAELGFNISLTVMYDSGYTKREIAAALALRPRDVERILDNCGPGVREYLKTISPNKKGS